MTSKGEQPEVEAGASIVELAYPEYSQSFHLDLDVDKQLCMDISPQLALLGRQSIGLVRHICEGQGGSQGLSACYSVFQKFVSVFLLGSTDYRQRRLTVLLQPACLHHAASASPA